MHLKILPLYAVLNVGSMTLVYSLSFSFSLHPAQESGYQQEIERASSDLADKLGAASSEEEAAHILQDHQERLRVRNRYWIIITSVFKLGLATVEPLSKGQLDASVLWTLYCVPNIMPS